MRRPRTLTFRPLMHTGGRETRGQPAPRLPCLRPKAGPTASGREREVRPLTCTGIPPVRLRDDRERTRTRGSSATSPWHSARSRTRRTGGTAPANQAPPVRQARRSDGERAQTRRDPLTRPGTPPVHPRDEGERARTRGPSATHPVIPPAHAIEDGREARDQPGTRLPARRRRAGENAWCVRHTLWHSARSRRRGRTGAPHNAATAGPEAGRCRRGRAARQWKAGTIR